ncbi:MAG TPA: hypothetical protein VER14_02670, partial [Phototrophicaceae bacterium]|nr:hypothetical protein [Phototrophicaceae bacterium]
MPKTGKDGKQEFLLECQWANHRCLRIHVLGNVFSIFDFEASNIKGECVVGKVCVILQWQGLGCKNAKLVFHYKRFG